MFTGVRTHGTMFALVTVLSTSPGVAASQAALSRTDNSWRVACPFDSTKALLPVTCGRLKVPENPANPGRVVEIAFMRVRAPRSIDQHGPVVFLNGGPGQNSLYYA
jgi:hypothetical protein